MGERRGDRGQRDGRQVSAAQVTEDALARIMARDPVLNSFTDVLAERARKRAQAIDDARAAKQPLGPLAGVPFAVKNLFDVDRPADARGLEDQPRACPLRRTISR